MQTQNRLCGTLKCLSAIQQIIKQYRETGLEPVLGEKFGHPAKPHDVRESEIVRLIMDHGSEFGAHRIHDDGSWNS